jgi:hypothetical protein
VLATRSVAGAWSQRTFASREFGLLRGTDLAVSPDGKVHVIWQTTLQRIRHRVWSDGAFGPEEEINDFLSNTPDLEIDDRGVPWVISPATDRTALSVVTPLDTTDEDGDGVTYLVERALRLNPTEPDAEDLPGFELTNSGGQQYLALTFLSFSGGSGTNPYVTADFEYYVERSVDMDTWSFAPSAVILKDRFSIPGRGAVHTFRSATPFASVDREFLRIRVVRR